jgi:rRNA-processing protein EBP2
MVRGSKPSDSRSSILKRLKGEVQNAAQKSRESRPSEDGDEENEDDLTGGEEVEWGGVDDVDDSSSGGEEGVALDGAESVDEDAVPQQKIEIDNKVGRTALQKRMA